jgi:hypothetical protein
MYCWHRELLAILMFLTLARILPESRVYAQQKGEGNEESVLSNGARSLSLLQKKLMQEELKLGEDQKVKLTELANARRSNVDPAERRKKNAELQVALEKLLSPPQLVRFKEIALQAHGMVAILDPTVTRALEITGDQTAKLRPIKAKFGEQMAALPVADREKRYFELEREAMKDAVGVLTQSQRDKYDKMKGEPVDVEALLANRAMQKTR